MKKLNLLLLGLATVSMSLLFVSCGEDETHDPPVVAFDQATPMVLGIGVTSATVTGTIVAEAGLKSVEFSKVVGTSETSLATVTSFSTGNVITTDNQSYTFSYVLDNVIENTTLKVKATDKDDQFQTQSIEIQVTVGGAINQYSAILMGAQSNATVGSFLDAHEGDVYLIAAAVTNSALIDVVYYYGSANLATLTAPDDVTVNGGAGNLTLCVDFTTKNATRFTSTTITASEFNNITNDVEIVAITGLTNSKMTQLAANDVVAFVTADNKKGLIKVAAITTGNNGTITIDVKIQE